MTTYSKESSNKVIEQIKKLLALAGSPNEHEAQLAMQRAQELMLKYNINSGALNDYETRIIDVTPDIMEFYPEGFLVSIAFDKWEPIIFGCIVSLFGCFGLVMPVKEFCNRKRFRLFGFPTNIDVALYTFNVILNQGYADFKAGYRKHRSITFAEGFWAGFTMALGEKFAKERKNVLENELYKGVMDKAHAQSSKSISTISVESAMGVSDGRKSGESVEIRPGVGDAKGVKGLLS